MPVAVGDVASGVEKMLPTCRPHPDVKVSERDCGEQKERNTNEKQQGNLTSSSVCHQNTVALEMRHNNKTFSNICTI